MRYENWDVIVFPRDSHIPIQEFKTTCYVSQDECMPPCFSLSILAADFLQLLDGLQLPTLTCYIASLPPSVPFRVSVHLWSLRAKPSAVLESRRKPNQRVVYTIQVSVDGVRVLCVVSKLICISFECPNWTRHDFFEANAWPQMLGMPSYAEHNITLR